jgi:poly(A) polymerase/tRNA nucleotidyltransferase (CCA-adding enzyme)
VSGGGGGAPPAADPPRARIDPPPVLRTGAPAAVLAALGPAGARAVGGAVRDTLAARPVHDVDVAAPLPPEAIVERLRAAGLKVFETGLAHGTVTAVLDHQPVEVTSLRRDVATDGRHAAVEWSTDWREDAARRDFTINAMSLSAAGELWDYFGGREDLAEGRVRFVGDPATRLAEDYLRALRFFRFQARYGRGAPDPAAMAAIRAAVPGLARLSAERVWMELKRLLEAPDPTEALGWMAEAGVLGAVLPEARRFARLGTYVRSGYPQAPLARLAALLDRGTDTAGLAGRLRLSNEEARAIAAYLRGEVRRPGADPASVRRVLADDEADAVLVRSWLSAFDEAEAASDPGTGVRSAAPPGAILSAPIGSGPGGVEVMPAARWKAFAEEVRRTPKPIFPLRGRDALGMGLPPGPHIGDMLGAVRDWWLEGGCVADREACLAWLRDLAAARGLLPG